MIKTRIVSSVEKCFLDEKVESFERLEKISMLKNERLSFQFLHVADSQCANYRILCHLTLSGELAWGQAHNLFLCR